MAAGLPLVVIMEKGAEAAEALNVTEIFYNRVADHIRNQPDAARSHAFDKQRMDELIQALDGWDDLSTQERSRRNKEIGNNRAYKMCKKFCVLDIAGELALVDLVHAPGDGPPVRKLGTLARLPHCLTFCTRPPCVPCVWSVVPAFVWVIPLVLVY